MTLTKDFACLQCKIIQHGENLCPLNPMEVVAHHLY
jgi:RNA polymerase subunit RPABC4/transcription elongation factor Spt4